MNDQLLDQLNRLIDDKHQCLCGRLDDLAGQMDVIHATFLERLENHEAYHRKHEHLWGLIKLAERYPFRLAALAFCAAWLLLALSPDSFL